MHINKIVISFFIMLIGCFTYCTTYAATGEPVAVLQYIADNMINELKANKATLKSKPQIVYRLAYRYVVPHADLPEMSKRVLPPQIWNSASVKQRSQFQKEFTTLLIRTYASALTSYQDQTIKFYPARGVSGRTAEVNSVITGSNSQPIRVSYRLVNSGGSWKLYDMSVEGVDMLESFRAQFSDILSRGNMDQLLARLAGHNRAR